MKKHNLEDLRNLYREAESVDQNPLSEMRSFTLLVSGEHYAKRNHTLINRLRASRNIPETQKIRLVMNHIGKITETYNNFISAAAPGVCFRAKSDKALSNVKSAELHESVWKDAKVRYKLDEEFDDSIENLVTLGEEWCILKWNNDAGALKGYQQVQDETGQMVQQPVFTGEFEWDFPYAFDMLADAKAKDLNKARFFIQRKVAFVDDLKAQFPEVADKIKEGKDDTFRVFDTVRGDYRDATDKEVTVKEFYFKKCSQYPNGYFYIMTDDVILAEGEIPFGVFPVVFQLFKKLPTYRRGISIVRRLRPFQVEINRAWSKMSEHQITLGDDKVILMNGTQVSEGMQRPGIDFVNATGEAPVVIPGRNGSQYLDAALKTIEQMYQIADIDDTDDNTNLQDAFAILYKAASQKKKFKSSIKRHERYLKDVCTLHAELAKKCLPDDFIIQAVSRAEAINIPEFKNASDLHTQVVAEEQSEDLETKFGRQLQVQQTLQYVGSQLEPEMIGALIESTQTGMPKSVTGDLTLKYNTATNVILALDRGENIQTSQYVDHDYMIKRLENRMTEADFGVLPPQVQQLYMQRIQMHEQMKSQNLIDLQRLEQGLIPTGGGLCSMDFYVPDPNSPGKLMRAKAPQQAVGWLFQQLDSQKWVLDPMMNNSQGSQAQVANQVTSGQQVAPQNQGPWQANTGGGNVPMAARG